MHEVNSRSVGLSPFGQLLELYLEAKEAEVCSLRTINHYKREVTAFVTWLHDAKPNCKPRMLRLRTSADGSSSVGVITYRPTPSTTAIRTPGSSETGSFAKN